MKQKIQSKKNRKFSNKNKTQQKKQLQKYILIFVLLIFTVGFFVGFATGKKSEEDIPAVSSVSSESVIPSLENSISEKKALDLTQLPWYLTLVNFEHPLEKDFKPEELAEADNGYVADSRIADAAKKMIADARVTENVRIIALSGYRDYNYQQELFDNKVRRLQKEKGCSIDEAEKEAATVVAVPGTSEHQLGLALDLVDARHVKLNESQENTAAYQWLYKHCHEYGFIVRYPNGKTDITGIIYEPWHFRYVGIEAATYIMENNLTLEEYLFDHYEP